MSDAEYVYPHICNEYCALGVDWARQPGRSINPHPGVRPTNYDEASDEPPFCAVCGHELLTWPEDLGAPGELHAYNDLEPFEEPRS